MERKPRSSYRPTRIVTRLEEDCASPAADPVMQPIVLINAVGLTPRLLPLAPRAPAPPQRGLGRPPPGGVAARPRPPPGPNLDRHVARGPRRRRQRLALPRHRRGPLLATVHPTPPGRAALRHRPPPGRRARP